MMQLNLSNLLNVSNMSAENYRFTRSRTSTPKEKALCRTGIAPRVLPTLKPNKSSPHSQKNIEIKATRRFRMGVFQNTLH